jgi:Mrp family chromosome partitioning ATPase
MSKIFDALRKAEQEPVELVATPEPSGLREEGVHPRRLRILEHEFGRLSSAVQSAFPRAREGRVLLIVGAVQREGSSYVAAHLARTLAADCGGPVLCLDANFHDPAIAKLVGLHPGLGLADIYENGRPRDLSEILQRGDARNLYVLTPGRRRIAPVAFFGSSQFEALLASMRRNFLYAVMDGPPILAHPDAIHLAARADGVILVVRHGRLKRQVLQKAIETLESVHAPILGAVLNRRRFAIPDLVYKLVS